MDLTTDALLEIAFDAVSATDRPRRSPPPADGVLAAAGAADRPRRHRDWDRRADGGLTSLTAFITTAAELGQLVDSLSASDWSEETVLDGSPTVRDLLVHMVGVERYLLGCLGRRPTLDAPRREDHWPVSLAAAGELADAVPDALAVVWWSEVLALVTAAAELGPHHPVAYHHLAGSLDGLLVVRTFELWTHADDIRRATGRPLDPLDEPRLSLMVDELVSVLPLGLALCGTPLPGCRARLILTGPGGGDFDVWLDPTAARPDGTDAGRPDVTITTAAIDLCRLAANRLVPSDLAVDVDGDRALLGPILAGAAAFAAD